MKTHALLLKEIALMYFPYSSQRAAITHLKRWINKDTSLYEKLLETGYTTNQRVYTPKQVRLIFEHLGEP